MRPFEINGRNGLVFTVDGVFDYVLDIEIEEQRIKEIYLVRNPDKLARVFATR